MAARFEKLSEPGQIGQVKTRNRMVKPAQSMHYATPDGYVSDVNMCFYETIARSGVGLLLVEMAGIDYPSGYPSAKDLRIDTEDFLPKLSELAGVIHKYNVPTFLQLNHSGISHAPILGTQPRAPSSLTLEELPKKTYRPPLGLTVPEIEDIVNKFAVGAERARRAGFDGVEVHGAHAYLIAEFLSNAWNKRQDQYGGSLENRARFACEVIKAIKQKAGKDFAVGIRVNGAEYGLKNGLTPSDAQSLCKLIAEAGADFFHVSTWGYGEYNRVNMPDQLFYPEPPSPLAEGLDARWKGKAAMTLLSAGVKKVVPVPVIAVGNIDPFIGETVLREGRADFVAIGRCIMADPEIPRKVMEGRPEDIRPCNHCLTCLDRYMADKTVVCRVNAQLGKEGEYIIRPAEKKKKVFVVGGGPAGMEAARVAAMRGHDVTLFEKEHELGGSMLVVAVVKGTEVEDLLGLARYYRVQLKKLGVKVKLGETASPQIIEQNKPDAVVLAVGGVALEPAIPGINSSLVLSQGKLHRMIKPFLGIFGPRLLRWLTNVYLPVGKRVVIIGGAVQGIELAEFLVKRGRKVTVTETADAVGADLIEYTKERLLPWLEKKGAVLLSGVKYERITDKGLTITTREGASRTIEADTILTALPLKPNTGLAESLKGKVPEVYLIGDSREPHLIVDAVAEGFRTSLNI